MHLNNYHLTTSPTWLAPIPQMHTPRNIDNVAFSGNPCVPIVAWFSPSYTWCHFSYPDQRMACINCMCFDKLTFPFPFPFAARSAIFEMVFVVTSVEVVVAAASEPKVCRGDYNKQHHLTVRFDLVSLVKLCLRFLVLSIEVPTATYYFSIMKSTHWTCKIVDLIS